MKNYFTLLLLLAVCAYPNKVFAGGFLIYGHDAAALALGLAYTAQVKNPSAVLYNPAAINQIEGTSFSTGGTLINSHVSFRVDSTGNKTNQDQNGLVAGDYHLTVTESNTYMCKKEYDFQLTQPASPLSLSYTVDSINCFAGTGEVHVTAVTGGSSPYSYTWTGPGILPGNEHLMDQSGLVTGSYHLEVKDFNDCKLNFDITLNQPDPLLLVPTITNVSCASPLFDDGEIYMSVEGGTEPYL